jgi:uncharacterized protein with GYD domain
MSTFIMFGKYTMDSVRGMSRKRTENASSIISDLGGEIKSAYALLGQTDIILIVDFPGVNEAMKASVELAKLLGVAFTTSPAVTIEEFDRLVGA